MPNWKQLTQDYVDTLETAIGAIEGATTLHNKLTAARAALLDQITAARLAELDAANLPADIDALLARLTAIRAGYLDELAAANIPADVDTLLARLTAARALLLDQITALRMAELDAANLPADIDTLLGRLTAARAALLDQITALRLAELDAVNLPADIDTLLARLTALRAGYLDNLSAGAVALAATALSTATWTAARAALIDQITALRMAELDAANIPADVDTLLTRLSALRAGYLDNLSAGAVALASVLTAARGGYMDFMPRVLPVSVTAAANAGITTVATVATQPVVIDSIILHADAAQTANLTSAAIQGGVGQVVTFISATDAAAANLNAADKQVGWTGAVRLAVGKTIIVNLVGTGAAAVDLTITITYHAEVAGGALS